MAVSLTNKTRSLVFSISEWSTPSVAKQMTHAFIGIGAACRRASIRSCILHRSFTQSVSGTERESRRMRDRPECLRRFCRCFKTWRTPGTLKCCTLYLMTFPLRNAFAVKRYPPELWPCPRKSYVIKWSRSNSPASVQIYTLSRYVVTFIMIIVVAKCEFREFVRLILGGKLLQLKSTYLSASRSASHWP